MNYQELAEKDFISCFKKKAKESHSDVIWLKKEIMALKNRLFTDEEIVFVCNGMFHFQRNLIVCTDRRFFIVHNGLFRGITIKEIKRELIQSIEISFNLKAPPMVIITNDSRYVINIQKFTLQTIASFIGNKNTKKQKEKEFDPDEFLNKESAFLNKTKQESAIDCVYLASHKIRLAEINNYISPSGGYLNYAIFKVGGTNSKSGRIKHITVEAKTEDNAIESAKIQGLVEPFSVEVVDFFAPSDAQINYAKSLGVKIPEGVTNTDISCILSRFEEDDFDSIPQSFSLWADEIGAKFSRFASLSSLIYSIKEVSSDIDIAIFYAYFIYERSLKKEYGDPRQCPKYNKIKQWAEIVSEDPVKIAKIRQRLDSGILKLSNYESDLLKFINS